MAITRRIPLGRLSAHDNFMQSPVWGLAKRGRRVTPLAFELDDAPSLLVLVHRAGPDASYAYVPWGPEPARESRTGTYLEALSSELRRWLPRDCAFVRFDLPWISPWNDEPGDRPPVSTRELEINFGTREHRLRKAPTDVQPADTMVVDLAEDDRLLGRMRSKTRYNIRLARRRGVQVRPASPDELDRWYEMYHRTMERHGKTVHGRHHFSRLVEATVSAPRAGVVPGVPAEDHNLRLLLAERHGRTLAGLFLAVSGSYAIYLYGASADRDRRAMPAYLLQWEAMRLARRLGADRYDMFGVPPDRRPGHPMHGLLRFKEGFGGRHVARRGCWDFPYDHERYRVLAGREAADRGYHG